MLKNKGKISIGQLFLLSISTIFSPAVWVYTNYCAKEAKQAAWLCPIVAIIPYLLILYIFKKMYETYGAISFADIIYDITSKFIGKIIVSLYTIGLTLLLLIAIRSVSGRLVSSITPNTKIEVYIITILVLVGCILKSGLVTFARMNEILLIISTIIFLILIILLLPNVKIENLTPISCLDISSIFKGSFSVMGFAFFPFVMFFSDKVSNINKFYSTGLKTGFFLWVFTTLLIIASVGSIGSALVAKSALSFLVAVKYINILDIIGGFESFLIISKLFTDFVSICLITVIILELIKSIFNLRKSTHLINIFLIFVYFLSMSLSSNSFELSAFTVFTTIPGLIVFETIIPVFIFLIGKIRKKF